MLLFYILVLFRCFLNIFLEIFLLLKSSFSLCSRNFSLHQLYLILSIIKKLLLFLELLIQLVDMGLEISTGSHNALDLSIKRCLLFTQLEKLLGISYRNFLLKSYLLFNFLLLVLTIFKGRFSNVLGALKLLSEFELISQFDFISFEFCLFGLQPLFFLKKFLIFNAHSISLICPFS